MREKNKKFTKALAESSVMLAFATVLSMLTLLKMPYGGSVTVASMLPVLIIAYRHGIGMGLACGLAYAVIQQLLGLNNLSYVTGWQSVLAVIMFDYLLAFTIVGLGGIFKGKLKGKNENIARNQSIELALGMLFVCILRYICHTVAGATVWAGLSIPTEAALVYSIGYNATYMIPETVVNVTAAIWMGNAIDFSKDIPIPMKRYSNKNNKYLISSYFLSLASKLIVVITVIIDTLLVFAHLQDPESGKFTFELLNEVNWLVFGIVSTIGFVLALTSYIISKVFALKNSENNK